MALRYAELTFTEGVERVQEELGTREIARRREAAHLEDERLSRREIEFIGERDSFYVASVLENGWPYVQHRGGPRGFLKVIDERTLGFADYRGNRQYISVGNVKQDDRVALFLMDYPGRRRLKLLARAEVFEASERPELVEPLGDAESHGVVERVFLLRVEAFDWNCPQYITPRFTGEDLAPELQRLHDRIAHLETELARERATRASSAP